MIRLVYCLYLIAIAPGSIRAQKLLFQHLGTDKGLIQSDVTQITQDKKGNIWIGTNAGISVYDGKKFTNYDDLRILHSLMINKIVCDQKGVMWIATDNGILKFDKQFSRIFDPPHPAFKRVFQLTVDKDNNKYFIFNRELYKIANNSDTATKWVVDIPSRSPIVVISVDPQNNFWIGTFDGEAYKISNGKALRLKLPKHTDPRQGKSPSNLISVTHSGGNFTAFTTSRGVMIVENDSLVYVANRCNQIPERSRTNVALKTFQGSMWIGSDSGTFRVDVDQTIKQLTKTNGFTDNSVTALFEDAERNLWFGTYGNGLFQLSTEAVSLYDQVDNIDLSNIESIAKIPTGDIILASYSQGIVRMKGQTFVKNPFSTRPPFFRYVTGLAAKGASTFVGTYGQGIFEYDNRFSILRPSRLKVSEQFINAILPYNRGFIVFAGRTFVYSFDNNHQLLARKEMPTLSSLFAMTDSTLIFVQNRKVDIYDRQLNLVQKNLFTEIQSRLSCLEFYGNYILAGTIGEGLFLYDKNYRFIKKLPSRSNIIYSLKISRNYLFIGSNVGLSKFPITGFPNLNNGEEKLIFNGECKEEGILSVNEDTIIVTSSKGLFVINTAEEDFNFTKPVLTLKSIHFRNNAEDQVLNDVADRIGQAGGNITLTIPYKRNELQVSLTGVSQSSPEQLRYQFILENYDKKWNTSDNGDMIRYTNLPAGNYVFKARLYSKRSVSQTLSIPFLIDRPLQAKWWFQILVFSLFILFAIVLLKVFNTINQRYIQTKWINRSTNELQTRKTLIGQLIKNTKADLQVFKDYLAPHKKQPSAETERYLDFYFKTTISRLDLLWEKDFMNLNELNDALRSFAQSSFNSVVEISHDLSNEAVLIPSEKAEKIIRLFALFIFYSIETNQARQFALTSKVRLGNQLFFKIYSTETVGSPTKNSLHRHLQTSICELNGNNFSVEFIESENLGNMIILNLNLEANHVIEKAYHGSVEASNRIV